MVIIGTVVWLVPLNTVIAEGGAGVGLRAAADYDPDAGWEQACDRWDQLHGGRTGVLIVTVVLQLAAIVVAS